MQSNEGSKHFTGRIKESQSFTHNTVKTYKKLLLSFCSSCVFIYWLFFNVSFDLFYFFFSFLLFKSPKLWEHRLYGKCCVYLCVSPSVILSASGMMFTDVSSCFCLSFHVVNPPPPPSYTFTKACPSSPQCDSISLLFSVAFSYHRSKSAILSHMPTFYVIQFPDTTGTDWAHTVQSVLTQQFYMATKQCNTQAKHSL